MNIQVAQLGLCWGIDRAYQLMGKDALMMPEKVRYATHRLALPGTNQDLDTLGRIARRDPRTLATYPGLESITVLPTSSSLDKGDTLLLGFYGLSREELADLQSRGVEVRDHKCPFIADLDKRMERAVADGFNLVFMGKLTSHHARYACEVAEKGGRRCVVVNTVEEFGAIRSTPDERWALFAQVTGNTLLWDQLVEANQKTGLAQMVAPTLCSDSYDRQAEALALAESCNAMLLVDDGGGGASSVFDRLSTRARGVMRVRWREDDTWKQSLDIDWFDGLDSLGIIGGINIPSWALAEVKQHIEAYARQ